MKKKINGNSIDFEVSVYCKHAISLRPKLEPAIWLGNAGQWISCFDRIRLTMNVQCPRLYVMFRSTHRLEYGRQV